VVAAVGSVLSIPHTRVTSTLLCACARSPAGTPLVRRSPHCGTSRPVDYSSLFSGETSAARHPVADSIRLPRRAFAPNRPDQYSAATVYRRGAFRRCQVLQVAVSFVTTPMSLSDHVGLPASGWCCLMPPATVDIDAGVHEVVVDDTRSRQRRASAVHEFD